MSSLYKYVKPYYYYYYYIEYEIYLQLFYAKYWLSKIFTIVSLVILKNMSRRPLPYPIYSMDGNIYHKVSNLRQFIFNCAASIFKH
jgi:hypothetical protein